MNKFLSTFMCFVILITIGFGLEAFASSIRFEYLGSFGRGPTNAPGEFNYPSGVGIDSNLGYVYVMDEYFNRIQKFDSNGNYIAQWKSSGGLGVAVNNTSHDVYVVSPSESKIRRYKQDGQIILEWGSYGSQEGQFKKPRDLAVNQINGNVFVIDSDNKRVQEFDCQGNFVKSWEGNFYSPYGITIDLDGEFVYVANSGSCNIQKFDINGNFLIKWGSIGSEPGKLRWPRGVCVDQSGNVLVADSDMERIQKFNSNGNLLQIFQGPHNDEDGPFHPRAIDVNISSGNIFAAASYAHRIDKFSSDGIYNMSWGHHERDGEIFNHPRGITIDISSKDVFVADTLNHLIKRFSRSGTFLKQFGGPPAVDRNKKYLGFPAPIVLDSGGKIWGLNEGIYYLDDPEWGSDNYVRQFDSSGQYVTGYSHPDFWAGMNGMAIQPDSGEIYISNTPKNKIMKFDSSGNLITEFGTYGNAFGQVNKPAGLALDIENEFVYVVDSGNQRIQKFDFNGQYIMSWGSIGRDPGKFNFNSYSGIAIDNYGNVYVADSQNSRVQVFDSTGYYISEFGSYGWGKEKFAWPADVTISDGIVYVMDTGGNEVEMYNVINVYEDAEDGLIIGWLITDGTPSGAQITNAFDEERQSRVIQFTGSGIQNGYSLGKDDGNWQNSKWHNSSQFVIEWSSKYSEEFIVYLNVETTVGLRHIYYTPIDNDRLGNGEYVHHGLGTNVIDGKWHTFFRDLQADLEEAQPGVTILEVNRFQIRGNGSVDDILLRIDIPPISLDTDNDGLFDIDETEIYGTNPKKADTDSDGISDGDELAFWEDIWNNDYDSDGLNNLIDWDSDGDGFSDGNEIAVGTDPSDPNNYPPTTIYEDAKDGLIIGWLITDGTPSGAQISNAFDEERQSRVIQFTGSGIQNGFSLGKDDGNWQNSKWHNSSQFVIEWSSKYSEEFIVYLNVETTVGLRHIYYTPIDNDRLGNGEYVHHGLGTNLIDGKWHTFVRDLQADLEEAQPGETILEVNRFQIRGNGSVDDILLRCE